MSDDRCRDVRSWLDGSDPRVAPEWVTGHARDCAACATALERARSLDACLADVTPAIAPAGFTESVLARLGPGPSSLARPALPSWSDPMPVWVRMAMEPAVVLALVLAALFGWKGAWLQTTAMAVTRLSGGAWVHVALPAPAWVLALGLLPVVLVVTVALYGWSNRLVSRGATPHPRIP
ncbi:MAG: hypothetical protein ACHQ52_05320 [Candidatus Eisenbacteria bacterium]